MSYDSSRLVTSRMAVVRLTRDHDGGLIIGVEDA